MSTRRKDRVIFIVGPTATGKTSLAIRLAKRIKGEIISCDSMQVYRGMGILSQAPTLSNRKSIKHYLVGILDPAEEYSAALFCKKAATLIRFIIKRGKTPIVVGGSGLYVKALIDGLFPSPEADMPFRKKMSRIAAKYGKTYLYKKLAKIDPISASRIHPNDSRRVIRALEIYHSTGSTMTELKGKTRGLKDDYDIKMFGLTSLREVIYSKINSRIEEMFHSGVVKEAGRLMKRKLSMTARTVIGLNDLTACLAGRYDLASAKDLVKMNTRRYAKRQLTWFRADKRIRWLDMSVMKNTDAVRVIEKEITKTTYEVDHRPPRRWDR